MVEIGWALAVAFGFFLEQEISHWTDWPLYALSTTNQQKGVILTTRASHHISAVVARFLAILAYPLRIIHPFRAFAIARSFVHHFPIVAQKARSPISTSQTNRTACQA